MRQRESSLGVAWGARRKPGPASPANMSKRGLPARHSVPNQTLSLVNFRLPKGNVAAANPGRPGGYGLGPGFHARKVAWAGWSPRPSRRPFGGLPQTQDGRIRLRVLAANCARGLLEELLALTFRGRREGRSVSAEPVCSCAFCQVCFAHETAGAACTRSSLRPLNKRAGSLIANLGRNAPRDRAGMFFVGWVERSETHHHAHRR